MKRVVIATSRNGHDVYLDTEDSHAATHLQDTPDLRDAITQLIPTLDLTGNQVTVEHEADKPLGRCDLVEVHEGDEIIYAKRKNRDNYTKFVKGREPEESRLLSAVFKEMDEGYELWSAWIGPIGEPFPGGEDETPGSREYWATRALVWGTQEIQPGTETTECPW